MTSIVKLSIQCDEDSTGKRKPGEEIAFLYPGEDDEWKDPYGGLFSDDEQHMFQRVAVGTSRSLVISAGTKWEATVRCRLVATFI